MTRTELDELALKVYDSIPMEHRFDLRIYSKLFANALLAAVSAELGVVGYSDGKYFLNETTHPERYTPLVTLPIVKEYEMKLLSDEEVRAVAKKYDLTLAFPCNSLHTSELFARGIERVIIDKIRDQGAYAFDCPDSSIRRQSIGDGSIPLYKLPIIKE